jgi:hypothetical protein
MKVFEDRVLRKIRGPKTDEVTAGWRKLHKEELHDMYSPPNIFRVMKSTKMGWAGHVTRMKRGEVRTGLCWGSPRERDHLENLGVDGRIILESMLRKSVGSWRLHWSGPEEGQLASSCKRGNELSGSIKCG